MDELGFKFEIKPAHIDEHHSGYKRPYKIVQSIALRKAKAIAKNNPNKWIIAADTIVVLNQCILLKPKNIQEAKKVISAYSQSFCDVYTGLALVKNNEIELVEYEKSRIFFFSIDEQAIDTYLKTGKWRQSSGSLTIEEVKPWVKRIEGSYSNILGLPKKTLQKMLKKTGYR